MKKYFIAVVAATLLAACNGKSAKDTPVLVEEETYAIETAAPDAPSLPKLPVVKTKRTKPINMRDSLKVDPKKGAVVKKKYKGTVPAADGPGIVYDLILYYQDANGDGVYELDATYLEANNGNNETFTSTGKRKVKKGIPEDAEAIVYELIPSDGSMIFYFLAEGDSLIMLNQDLQKAPSDLNYTLILEE